MDLRPKHLRPKYDCPECFGGVAYSNGGLCYDCQRKATKRFHEWAKRQEEENGWDFYGAHGDMF